MDCSQSPELVYKYKYTYKYKLKICVMIFFQVPELVLPEGTNAPTDIAILTGAYLYTCTFLILILMLI